MEKYDIVKQAKISNLIIYSFMVAVGLAMLIFREIPTNVETIILSVLCILVGGAKILGYFSNDLYRLAFQFDLSLGLMLAVLGVIILRNPDQAMSFLCLMLGIATMADGLFKLQSALDARRFGLKSWPLILTLAVGAGVVGALLMLRPMQSARALTVLLGIGMMLEGVLNLCVALFSIKIIRHQRVDGAECRVE